MVRELVHEYNSNNKKIVSILVILLIASMYKYNFNNNKIKN